MVLASCDSHVTARVSVQNMADDAKFVNYLGNFMNNLDEKYAILTGFEEQKTSKSGCGL